MQDSSQQHHTEPSDRPTTEADRLMTRLIDGECAAADRGRFEQLAADDPSLWRELALRQIHAAQLCAEASPIINRLSETPLPNGGFCAAGASAAQDTRGRAVRSGSPPFLRVAAWTGWAATLVFAAVWTTLAINRPVNETGVRPANETPSVSSASELWNDYLAMPHVQGELEPIVLETIERPDGRIELRYLRRVEEVQTFGSIEEVPRNERDGVHLAPPDTTSPADSPAAEPVRP